MPLKGQATLLRVFVGESDRLDGRPLHERILLLARERGLAGATVVRGVASYGASSRLHTAKVLRLSEDLPIVIEIVDSAESVTAFLPELDALLERAGQGGLVTLEKVDIIRYAPHGS
jgi:hypothetical protein